MECLNRFGSVQSRHVGFLGFMTLHQCFRSNVEDNEPPSEPSETEPSEVETDVDHDTTISSISLDLKLWEPRNPDVFQSQEELVATIDIPSWEY